MSASVGPAQPRGALGDASRTGWRSVGELAITRRISAGGRLLLQRLGQLAIARLQLREQPHVLDGDDGLVGEGLEQRDLLVGERAGSSVRDDDRADRRALAQQRRRETGSGARRSRESAYSRIVVGIAPMSAIWIVAPLQRSPRPVSASASSGTGHADDLSDGHSGP